MKNFKDYFINDNVKIIKQLRQFEKECRDYFKVSDSDLKTNEYLKDVKKVLGVHLIHLSSDCVVYVDYKDTHPKLSFDDSIREIKKTTKLNYLGKYISIEGAISVLGNYIKEHEKDFDDLTGCKKIFEKFKNICEQI